MDTYREVCMLTLLWSWFYNVAGYGIRSCIAQPRQNEQYERVRLYHVSLWWLVFDMARLKLYVFDEIFLHLRWKESVGFPYTTILARTASMKGWRLRRKPKRRDRKWTSFYYENHRWGLSSQIIASPSPHISTIC